MKNKILLLLLILILLLIPAIIKTLAARQLEKELPALIGKADAYRVTVNSPLFGLLQGKINRLRIVGKRVEIKDNPVIQELEIILSEVKLNLKSKKIERVKESVFSASFREKDLNKYLENRPRPFEEARLELKADKLLIKGRYRVFLLTLPVELEAAFYVVDEEQIFIRLESLKLSEINFPKEFFGLAEAWVNPLVDLKKGNLAAKIKSITIKPGNLIIKGSFSLPETQK